jgi:spore maturation protein CgeB
MLSDSNKNFLISCAFIADLVTTQCLNAEKSFKIKKLSWLNYEIIFSFWKPDFIFVESAWEGNKGNWKYEIASYPERKNQKLARLIQFAKDKGIPTVFWNKEDGIHFDRFIESAKLFDHIFTVDENCIPRYKATLGEQASVHTLPFPVQPAIHSFTGFNFKYNKANFVGSYSHHIHDERRKWQDMTFQAAADTGLGLTVFDRNSHRKAQQYRYPMLPCIDVRPSVEHRETAQIYKDYLISLNVNTITDSPTMYSRRLIEILACGGIAVTSPSLAVDKLFKDCCHVVATAEEAKDLFERLKYGPNSQDLERARAGSEYVLREYTWGKSLEKIINIIGLI